MGCIGSHLSQLITSDGFGRDGHVSARRKTVFPVLNVDELGRHISPGKLEVTEGDLILHINGRPSLVWPLRALRRYGYENDLFSFEAGRRCPTGHGIYAFKCSAAQTLFELLQAKIQGNPGALPVIPLNTRLPTTSSASAQANLSPLSLSPTFDYVNIMDSHDDMQQRRRTSSAVDIVRDGGEEHPLYVNVEGTESSSYANLDSSATNPKPSTSNGRLGKLRNGLPPPHFRESPNAALYTNLAPTASQEAKNPEVNYVELDLEQQGPSQSFESAVAPPTIFTPTDSPVPTSRVVSRTTSVTSRTVTSTTGELGYATIDFDRTAALSVVTRSKIKLGFGGSSSMEREEESEEVATTVIRKTRHNSTVL